MDAHKNFAVSQVATAPSPASSGTSLVVQSGHGARFPAVSFNAVVWPNGVIPTPLNAEVVRVTNISTDTLTITRTQESSSARTIVVGDLIATAITAKTLTDIETMPQSGGDLYGSLPSPSVQGFHGASASGGAADGYPGGGNVSAPLYLPKANAGQAHNIRWIRTTASDANPRRLILFYKTRDTASWEWSGPIEITVRSPYWTGAYSRSIFTSGYSQAPTITVLEAVSSMGAGPQAALVPILLGAEVTISGTLKYQAVAIDLPYYQRCVVELRYMTNEVGSVGALNATSQIFIDGTEQANTGTGASAFPCSGVGIPALQVGADIPQAARLSARGGGNGFEFGHNNPAGYVSTLGADQGGGQPWLIFSGEAGSTSNTYKSRGMKSSILRGDLAGGFVFGTVANASADNQDFVQTASLSSAGVLTVGAHAPVSNALLSTVTYPGGNGIEFGCDYNGGRSTLGSVVTDGWPFLAFCATAGTGDTFTTRGKNPAIIMSKFDGGFVFGTIANASAANQTFVQTATLNSIGTFMCMAALNPGLAAGGAGSYSIYQSGTGMQTNATAWTLSSDGRLKEAVEIIEKPLDKLKALRGVRFRWKEHQVNDFGFIAQEVQEVFPELVIEGDDEQKTLGMDKSALVAPLWEACKEMLARIEALESRLTNV